MPCRHTLSDKCELCDWLKGGRKGPIPKNATRKLNQASRKPKVETRECPACSQEVDFLVSRGEDMICESCAEKLDEEEET